MLNFRDWIVFDEFAVGLWEESVLALKIEDAASEVINFYNSAVSGRWDVIAESYDEEDDDGPVELDDPFAGGDEDAKPAWTAPEEDEAPQPKEEEDPRDEGENEEERTRKLVSSAKRLKRLAQMVRWGAMLDRQRTVEQVAKIYRDEWLPLMAKRGETKTEHLDAQKSKRIVWSVLRESDDDLSPAELEDDLGTQKQNLDSTFEDSLKSIILKASPLLVKLGYLKPGDIESGNTEDKIKALSFAMESASKEKGNQPPLSEEGVKKLMGDPRAWDEAKRGLGEILYKKLLSAAQKRDRDTSVRMSSASGTAGSKKRSGAKYHQGWEDILNHTVMSVFKSLTERSPNKDGTNPDWNDDLTVLDFNPEEAPTKAINSWRKSIKMGSMERDETRAERRASGMRSSSTAVFTCSKCGKSRYVSERLIGTRMECPKCKGDGLVQRVEAATSHDAGAVGEDGTRTSIDPTDSRTRDSLGTSVASETGDALISAFKQAMSELKSKNSTQSILACLWFSLDCTPDGTPTETKARQFMSAAGGQAMSSRVRPDQFLHKLGLEGHLPDKVRGRGGLGGWKLVEMIVQKNLPRVGPTLGRRPEGNMPDVLPNYTMVRNNPGSITPQQMEWWRFYNTVNDAKDKGIEFIAKKMNEILMSQSDSLSLGQENANSWSLSKFLNATYRDQVSSGHAVIGSRNNGAEQEATIQFYDTDRKRVIRSYKITADGTKVSIVQDGFENNVFRFSMPESNPGQPMDSRMLMKLEWNIKERLDKRQRKK